MTILTGTIYGPDGLVLTGSLYLQLAQDANLVGGGVVSALPPRVFNVVAGAISGPGSPPFAVDGADTLLPPGLTYHLTLTGPGGEIVLERDIIITGASVDLGTVVSVTAPSAPLPFSVLGGDVTGPAASTTVGSIRNRPLSTLAPTPGQSLNWNGSAWAPLTPAAGPLGTIASDGSVPLTANWNAGNFKINSQNSESLHNVVAYGADASGATDSTTAIASAVAALPASGGTIYFPTGVFVTDQIDLTSCGGFGKRVRFIGAGMQATTLIPKYANSPLFRFVTPGTLTGAEFAHFAVKAHVSGSTGPAFNMEYFGNCYIHHIEYLSNASGTFASMFYMHAPNVGAQQYVCYGNRLSHIYNQGQSGPAKMVLCFGEDANKTPNINYADNWRVNGTINISAVFDVGNSFSFHIEDCWIEGNTGTVVLYPGSKTTLMRSWIEGNATQPIQVGAGYVLSPIYVTIADNQFAGGAPAIVLTAACNNWDIRDNYTAPTVTDGGTQNLVQQGSLFSTITGSVTGSAATVTGAAQPNITSVGTLTSLGVGSAPSSGKVYITNSTAAQNSLRIIDTNTDPFAAMFLSRNTVAGTSNGIYIDAGTNASDYALTIRSATDAVPYFFVRGDGNVGIGTATPTSKLHVVGLPIFANNLAATTGGLTVGAFYRTGADPDLVCVVH